MTLFHPFDFLVSRAPLHSSGFHDLIENEAPAYISTNTGDLNEGTAFTIAGHLPPNCERFEILLIVGNSSRDIAMRVNPRFPQSYVLRNARINHLWGVEEDSSSYSFALQRGKKFQIQILITELCYMISLNGSHFAKFNHRLAYRNVATIEVSGDVANVKISRQQVTEYPEGLVNLHLSSSRIRMHSVFVPNLYHRLQSISYVSIRKNLEGCFDLPYYGFIGENQLGNGKQLRLEGRVKLLPLSFLINLQSGQHIWPHPIVAFHFRCYFSQHRDHIDQNVIAQSAWKNGDWVKEDVYKLSTDLCPAKNFSLVIVRTLDAFEVYVNRKFITDFPFFVNPDIVDTVFVLGDIKVYDVILEDHDTDIFNNSPSTSSWGDIPSDPDVNSEMSEYSNA